MLSAGAPRKARAQHAKPERDACNAKATGESAPERATYDARAAHNANTGNTHNVFNMQWTVDASDGATREGQAHYANAKRKRDAQHKAQARHEVQARQSASATKCKRDKVQSNATKCKRDAMQARRANAKLQRDAQTYRANTTKRERDKVQA